MTVTTHQLPTLLRLVWKSDYVFRWGEVAEWSKAHAWKVCRRETVSRVRIPLSPPIQRLKCLFSLKKPKIVPPVYPPLRQGLPRNMPEAKSPASDGRGFGRAGQP